MLQTVGSHIHPSWNGKVRAGHDIALVFLEKEIPGPYLNVPGVAMPWTVVPNNHPMTFVGYYAKGSDRKQSLKEAFLPFRSRSDCLEIYNNHRSKLYPHKSFICAGGSGYKVCLDDVGGPLIIKGGTPEDDMAIGVLSGATTGSCWMDVSLPALFTSFAGLQEGLDIIKSSGDSCNRLPYPLCFRPVVKSPPPCKPALQTVFLGLTSLPSFLLIQFPKNCALSLSKLRLPAPLPLLQPRPSSRNLRMKPQTPNL